MPLTRISYQIRTCFPSSARPNVKTAKYGPRSRIASTPTSSARSAATPAATRTGHGSRAPVIAVAYAPAPKKAPVARNR